MRKLIVAAVALCGMAIGAGSAQGAPLHATFDDAALHIYSQPIDLLDPPNQATLQGADVTAGVVTIPSPSGVSFPPASGTFMGFTMTVSVEPTGTLPITGTLNGGDLSLSSHSYRATLSLAGGPTCAYDTDLAFDTANPSGGPFNGDPFTTWSPDTTLTDGALETHWDSLPPAPQPGCDSTFNLVADDPGGFALANGIDLPGTPLGPLSTSAGADPTAPTGKRAAALKRCKRIESKKKRLRCKRRARKLPV